MNPAQIAQAAEASMRRTLRSFLPLRKGVVTAVSSSPARVTVNGRSMPYIDSYATPAVDDNVTYASGPDPICLGKIAT